MPFQKTRLGTEVVLPGQLKAATVRFSTARRYDFNWHSEDCAALPTM